MEIRHSHFEIDLQKPFQNCELEREKYANILSAFIEKYNKNLVLAINNPWGTGKSTFIKMWEQSLRLKGYNTAFFNAWENDFNNDPLTAIIGELSMLKGKKKIELKKVVDVASKLTSELIPLLIKGFAEKKFGKEFTDFIDATVKGSGKVMQKYVEDYTEKKESLAEFRSELEKAINEVSPDKPVVFFIDELDRCRPNYSVEILEKVKHFFNVKNIIFVLAIDKLQLSHAICGVYNSEKINAEEYLKRFIDIEYTIPEPKTNLYINYLSKKFDINSFFAKENRVEELRNYNNYTKEIFGKSSLRTIEKMMGILAVSLFLNHARYIHFPLLLFLIYLKIEKNDDYEKYNSKKMSVQQMRDNFVGYYHTFPTPLFSAVEAQFAIAYANYISSDALFKFVSQNGNILYHSTMQPDDVKMIIEAYNRDLRTDTINLSLEKYLSKINITEEFDIF